jgi:enoyl-CoA hydratase/3-hydroxyacyl-CoA dehydrogenase
LPANPPGPPTSAAGAPLSLEILTILDQAVRDAAAEATLEAALAISYRAFGRSACTAAAREGIAAFGEGRAPDFSAIP